MKCIKDPSLSGNLSCTLRFVLGEQQSSVEDHWLRPCLFYPQREVFAVEEAYTSHKRTLKYLTPHVRLFIYLFHILFWFEAFYEEFAQKVRPVLYFLSWHIHIYFKIQLISLHFRMKKGSIGQGRMVSIFQLDRTIIFIS